MKSNKLQTTLTIILFVILIATVFLGYNIYLLGPIEQTLRLLIAGILLVINTLFIIYYFKLKLSTSLKKRSPIIYLSLGALYIILAIVISFLINYLFGKINNVNRDYINYTTAIVTLNNDNIKSVNDLNNKKLGLIDDEKSPDGYIISQDIIKSKKLKDNNEIVSYSSFTSMIGSLYEGEVDAIFISNNYTTMFSQIEDYKDISIETKVIYKQSKMLPNTDNNNNVANKNVLKDPFTVLLMGVDSEVNGLNNNAAFNGDSLLLMTFNPKTLNATILSIPRDSYVPITCFKDQIENKITHAAWYGANCMMNTISNFTNIKIDYYAKVNFKALVALVDAVGGVDIDVEYSFCEQNSDRKWGKDTVYVKSGLQNLKGEQALAFSRNRHTWPQYCSREWNLGNRSDIVRGQHQQEVIEALLKKLKNISSINSVTSILDSISNNFDTNMTTNQILSFYEIGKDILKKGNVNSDTLISIEKLSLKTSSQMIYDENMKLTLSDQIINQDSLSQVTKAMKINLGLEKPELIKTFTYEYNEDYQEKVIGNTNVATKLYDLLPNFIGKKKSDVASWASKNGISVVYNVVKSSNSNYVNDQIIKQSLPTAKRIDKITNKTITVDVVEKVTATTTERIDCSKEEDSICTVPNFEAKKRIDVLNWINKIKGLVVKWDPVLNTDTTKPVNEVFDQSISAGTIIKNQSEFTIKVVTEKSI